MRWLMICIFPSGCFIGLPPLGKAPWLDTASPLSAPDCASVSIEPDNGATDTHFSPFGLLTDEARTLCGEIDQASNDGQSYTGDVDYAQFQTIDDGQVRLTLDWDGKTDLDLLVYDGNAAEWIQSDDDEIELSLDSGFHAVLVAGVDGPPTEYVLTARIE